MKDLGTQSEEERYSDLKASTAREPYVPLAFRKNIFVDVSQPELTMITVAVLQRRDDGTQESHSRAKLENRPSGN